MSLFSHDETTEKSPPKINPIVVRTSNVAKELLQTAATYKVPVQTLDFTILSVQTFSKLLTDDDADWIELTADEIQDLTEDLYLNPNFELKQVYEIEICSLGDEIIFPDFDVSIGGNSTLCKIFLTVKKGSKIQTTENFEKDLIAYVNKKKLRANVLIGIFDSIMIKNLNQLIAKVRVDGSLTFTEQERYLISEGFEPVETINDKLILHYEKKQKNEDEQGRINYAKRGFIISAMENDLLIEYIKPKKGENGRNCRGEFIAPKEPIVKNEPTFNLTENILVIDNPNTIEYRSKIGGYVTFENGTYDISREVEISEISFKTTGSIETELNADVSISVKETDVLKDAIGMGMEVEVKQINIDGSVGPNAKVKAQIANVEGQVHQSATISADELSINILKGTAYGKQVRITRLEHGTVEAEKVTIVQATGGKVRAKEIVIETLGSHVKLTASHTIEIKKLVGGENQLVIDPLLDESNEHLDEQSQKMEQVSESIKEIKKEITLHEQSLRENAPAMNDLKQKLSHYKENGIKMPVALVQKYQQFLEFKHKLDALKKELLLKEDQYAFLSTAHNALQDEIFDARIINHDRWRNHNEIIFRLIEPPVEVFYLPPENSSEKYLGLYQDETGQFSVKVMPK